MFILEPFKILIPLASYDGIWPLAVSSLYKEWPCALVRPYLMAGSYRDWSQSSSTNKQYCYNVIWLNMLIFGTIANFWAYLLIWRAASSLYKATSHATETVFDGRRVSRLRGPGEKSKKEATSHPWESKPVTLHKSVFWQIFRPMKLYCFLFLQL